MRTHLRKPLLGIVSVIDLSCRIADGLRTPADGGPGRAMPAPTHSKKMHLACTHEGVSADVLNARPLRALLFVVSTSTGQRPVSRIGRKERAGKRSDPVLFFLVWGQPNFRLEPEHRERGGSARRGGCGRRSWAGRRFPWAVQGTCQEARAALKGFAVSQKGVSISGPHSAGAAKTYESRR